MKKLSLVATAAFALLSTVPTAATAQGFGVGARAGTLGVGGEAAIDLTDRVVLRGSLGFMPIDPEATFDDLDVTLVLPTWYGAGVDFYLNGAFRVGAGMLFKPDDPELRGDFTSPQEIGNQTFTPQEIGTLTGTIDSSTQAPYVLIGFGKHTDPGVGLFIDLGVAFLSEPEVVLGAEGGSLDPNSDPLRTELDREAAQFEDDMREYLRFWPILNLGLRIGFD